MLRESTVPVAVRKLLHSAGCERANFLKSLLIRQDYIQLYPYISHQEHPLRVLVLVKNRQCAAALVQQQHHPAPVCQELPQVAQQPARLV